MRQRVGERGWFSGATCTGRKEGRNEVGFGMFWDSLGGCQSPAAVRCSLSGGGKGGGKAESGGGRPEFSVVSYWCLPLVSLDALACCN